MRQVWSSALAVPLSLLIGGAVVYGVIALQGIIICADYGCESASGPGLAIAGASLLAGTIAVLVWTRATSPNRAIARWFLILLCAAICLVSALVAVIWAGTFYGSVFRDFANPWYHIAFLGSTANYLAFASSTSRDRIFWLGWPIGGGVELALDVLSTVAVAIGALLVARTAWRASLRAVDHKRSLAAAYLVAITGFALALDVVVTIPAEAHDASGFRAAHYLAQSRRALVGDMNAVLTTANQENDPNRAEDVASGDASALRRFADSLAAIPFPDWVPTQLGAEKAALTNEIVAATDLGTAANTGTYPRIQDAYHTLDDALQRENEAERALYLALFPQAYLHDFVRS